MPPVNSARVAEVDALRGIAAVAVMLFHYTTRIDELYPMGQEPLFSVPQGHFGVNLFFIISGYVIFMTLQQTRQPMDFVVSRFSRLFPAYWAAVVITFAITTWLGLPGKTVTSAQAAGNLLMIHGLFGIPHVDGVYWTLEVELLFYAGMFTLFVRGQLARVYTWLWLALGLRLAYHLAPVLAGVDLPWMVYRLLILAYMPWFVLGIGVFLYMHPRGPDDKPRSLALLLGCLLLVGLTEGLAAGAMALALAGLVWAAASRKLPWLRHPSFVWLGSISYTLYLLHENIGWAVQLQLRDLGVDRNLAIVCVVALSLALATALTKLVEQPAMAWIRQRWRQRSGP
jgi:peptidoglycan/LPS O-acetylase OafA/YrhL